VTIESTAEMAAKVYETMERNLAIVRRRLGRPLTLADKVLLGHADDPEHQEMEAGKSYLFLRPDRVVLQDVLGQTAMLQFMQTRRQRVAVPTSIHCDHLIQARVEGQADLRESLAENQEVYDFLRSAAAPEIRIPAVIGYSRETRLLVMAGIWSIGTIARGAGIDEFGIVQGERLVIEPQSTGDAFAEVLYEDVRSFDELVDDISTFGFLEVKSDAFLVAVIGLEIVITIARRVGCGPADTHDAATRVPADPIFDLDNLSAEIAEHHGRYWSLLPDGPIENANSFQNPSHECLASECVRRRERAYAGP